MVSSQLSQQIFKFYFGFPLFMATMQKIVPFLWYDKDAEDAANYYTSVFKNSKVTSVTKYDEAAAKGSGMKKGSVMTVAFQLEGMNFVAINGGPMFKFTEPVSFVVNCKDQKEIDYFWEKLSKGGQEGPCGWLKDRFGL